MSMPHDCKCGICGHAIRFGVSQEEREAAELAAEVNRATGVRVLASALMKIAPELADAIGKRWEEVQQSERVALDAFLAVLRSPQSEGESLP